MRFIRLVLLGFFVDEVAVESELADDGVHLAKRELRPCVPASGGRSGRVGRDAALQGGGAAVVGQRGAVLAGQRQHALNAADRDHAAARRTCARQARRCARRPLRSEPAGARWRAACARAVLVRDAVAAALLAQMFAQQLAGAGIEHADDTPSHCTLTLRPIQPGGAL